MFGIKISPEAWIPTLISIIGALLICTLAYGKLSQKVDGHIEGGHKEVVVRLETIVDRMEKAVDRLDHEVRTLETKNE